MAFLYAWGFLNKMSLDWPLTLKTQLSTSKLSDNPGGLIPGGGGLIILFFGGGLKVGGPLSRGANKWGGGGL